MSHSPFIKVSFRISLQAFNERNLNRANAIGGEGSIDVISLHTIEGLLETNKADHKWFLRVFVVLDDTL